MGFTAQLITTLVAFLLSILLVPLVRWFGFRLGKVSQPRQDRWHRKPTPMLGGIAMFLAFVLALAFWLWWSKAAVYHWGLLAGATLSFLVGVIDDFKRLTPIPKLFGQLLAALIFVFVGDQTIRFFPWPVANILLTIFWLVGISNAINLLDNMDGLAGGVSLISAGMLAFFAWNAGDPGLLAISLALAGGILGFLVFNFPPAKIFMSDSGSLFLGFTLAALAVALTKQASNVFAVVGVPTLIFLLPILDTSLVTVTRLLRGQSPARGGTDHTSHRLVAFGLSERQAVLVLYGVALISGAAAVGLEALNYELSLVLVPLVLLGLLLFTAYLGRLKVVMPADAASAGFTRLIADLTYKRRVLEILLDLLLVSFSYYLAYWIGYGLDMTSASMQLFLQSWPFALAAAYLCFFLAGVYRSAWSYFSFEDLGRTLLGALGASAIAWLSLRLIYAWQTFPLQVFALFAIVLFLALAGSRASFTVLDRLYHRQRSRAETQAVLIYGAGSSGEFVLLWLLQDHSLDFRPMGFLDEDERLWGRSIRSVDVLGGCRYLENLAGEHTFSGVIVSSTGLLEMPAGQRLLAACRAHGIWVKVMHVDFESVQ